MTTPQEPAGPANRLTLERKVETLIDQLAVFDQRIRVLEMKVTEMIAWSNNLYHVVKPMLADYRDSTHRKGRTTEGPGDPPETPA